MSPNQRKYLTTHHRRMSAKEMADNLKVSEEDVTAWKQELNLVARVYPGPKKKPVPVEDEAMFKWGKNWPF